MNIAYQVTKANNISPGSLYYPRGFNLGYRGDIVDMSNRMEMINGYKEWIYVCCNINSRNVASQKLKLYVAKNRKKKLFDFVQTRSISKEVKEYIYTKSSSANLPCVMKSVDIEEVVEHPWHDLMHNVNKFHNRFDNDLITQLYLELTGNSYWYLIKNKFGTPVEIWTLQSQRMSIIPDKKDFIKGYLFDLKEYGDQIIYSHEYEAFDEDEIVHFKFPSPKNAYYGFSPITAISYAYNTEQNMNIYELSVFKNMGRLEGAYTTEQVLTNNQFERLEEQIKKYKGAKNAGKSPLLGAGVKYINYALTPRDLNFLQGRTLNRQLIFAAYDISEAKVLKNAKYSNNYFVDYEYMKEGIYPRMLLIEEKINEKIMPIYDDNIFVVYDNPIPRDKEFILKKQTEQVKSGIRAIDEVRQEEGLKPFGDGLDRPLIPFGLAPWGNTPPQQLNEESKLKEITRTIARMVLEKLKN
ncbi:MAG: phage portal protein [Candidatus Thorarchaeota archaeon]